MKKFSIFFLLMALFAPLAMNAQTVLFSEDFESGVLPAGWTMEGPGTWSVGTGDASTSTGAGQGRYNALITHSVTDSVTRLITPPIDLSWAGIAKLEFKHIQRASGSNVDQLRVYSRFISADTWRLLGTYTSAVSSWTTDTIFNLPILSTTYQLAFEFTDKNGCGIGLDDITIVEGVCPKPTLDTYVITGVRSATVNWIENGDAVCWELHIGTDSTFQPHNNWWAINLTMGPPYTITELEPATTYYLRMKADCSCNYNGGSFTSAADGDDRDDRNQSDWSNIISFTTKQLPLDVGDGWSDDFEGEVNWLMVNGGNNAWVIDTAVNNGGNKALYISNDGGATNAYTGSGVNIVYATKHMTFETGQYVFEYDWRANGERSYDYMRAWLAPSSFEFTANQLPNGSISMSDYTTTTPQGWISLDGGGELNLSSSWHENQTAIVDVTAGDYYVVFMWGNDIINGVQPPAAIDNFSITKVTCLAPTTVTASNVTGDSAEISWESQDESFDIRYRVKDTIFFEDFEGLTGVPAGWTLIDNDGDGKMWGLRHNENNVGHSGNNCMYSYSYETGSGALTPDNWLITPRLDLQGTMNVWLKGVDSYGGSYYLEHFAIYLSTTGTNVADFTTVLVPESITTDEYVEYIADLSEYAGQQGYIAIRHFDCTDQNSLELDDFSIIGGTWQTVPALDNHVTLTGLTAETEYEVQVQGFNEDCNNGVTPWSAPITFTTPFSMTKHIIGYGLSDGGYYLIASPLADAVTPAQISANMTTGDYDLFTFDESAGNDEWRNYKVNAFSELEAGKGYLYAHRTDVDLVFTGTPYSGNGEITLSKTDNVGFSGWNLVGNPFAEIAFIADGRDFYTMGIGGTEIIIATSNSIEAMEGIFVVATVDQEVITFTNEDPNLNKTANLALNLVKDEGVIDRAIVRFGESSQLPKFQINSNSAKLYIPMDDADYAVVSSTEMGELPLNFKAKNDGLYTISVSSEEVSFGYLHLIDNMTGAEVDLLATPSYSFEAKSTDYASRFKLVFAVGSSTGSETFAFYSNGRFVINNEGDATVQVIDIDGHILSSETINGCADVSVNATAGVYMIRLINGESVKVQKVVVVR